jgi:hypothetical protein
LAGFESSPAAEETSRPQPANEAANKVANEESRPLANIADNSTSPPAIID